MSRGIGGGAEILSETETKVIYKYYNYRLCSENSNDEKIMDGKIIIEKIK